MRRLHDKRVLLVEDDALVLLHLEQIVTALGCKVSATASAVVEGVTTVKSTLFDMALLNVDLHGRMSFPVADALLIQRVPFAFTTGFDEKIIPRRYLGVPIVQKPYGSNIIARTLMELWLGSNSLVAGISPGKEGGHR